MDAQSNLFKKNLDKKHVKDLGNLKQNIAFAQRIVDDLEGTFNVVVRHKRYNETRFQIIVYPPNQVDRYGWGFTFEATKDGVEFTDSRGVWLPDMGRILGVKVTNDYDKRKEERDALSRTAEKVEVEVTFESCSGGGDHFGIKTTLSENDKHLDAKIKLIIGTMQAQSVTTRL